MRPFLLEICCGSVEDACRAAAGGADRIELNSCLFHGGLTPSIGELIVTKEIVSIPIIAMVRPRQGGFCYTDAEFRTAIKDAECLLKHGADGLVFGFLKEDGTLDKERCKTLLSQMDAEKVRVFHRAIDVTPDWKKTLDGLIELGFQRVLTSGQEPSALYGAQTIAEMVQYVQGAIEILPGAGINLKNADQILSATGCTQIHLTRFMSLADPSTQNNRGIFFGGALYPPEDRYDVIDSGYVQQLRALAPSLNDIE